MGSFDRKFKRQEERQELVTEAQQRLPVGKVVTSPVKGEFLALPMFGWISLRKNSEIRLLMLAVFLLREAKISGMLHIEFPVYPETERDTVWMLQEFGWDGRVWPQDEGWPTGSGDEEDHRYMLGQVALAGSLVFPPKSGGHPAMNVSVERARGNFFMPPLPEAKEDPDEKLVARFRDLCQNYKVFYKIEGKSEEKRDHDETLH
jgi:hypothetical protein